MVLSIYTVKLTLLPPAITAMQKGLKIENWGWWGSKTENSHPGQPCSHSKVLPYWLRYSWWTAKRRRKSTEHKGGADTGGGGAASVKAVVQKQSFQKQSGLRSYVDHIVLLFYSMYIGGIHPPFLRDQDDT